MCICEVAPVSVRTCVCVLACVCAYIHVRMVSACVSVSKCLRTCVRVCACVQNLLLDLIHEWHENTADSLL